MRSSEKFLLPGRYTHWVWITGSAEANTDLYSLYKGFADAHVHGLLFDSDNEVHYRAARDNNLVAHRWLWTLNQNDRELMAAHPDWYTVNRNGESCVDKPPYVDYYRWLCPNNTGVIQFISDKVRRILEREYIDGVHLDYIRYSDVILPANLWSSYGIRQTEELGQYDYCYCPACRERFMAIKKIDPLHIPFPDQHLSWREFRYNSITGLVNELTLIAAEYGKRITAAVFPTPEVAKRLVRQDWTSWDLDGVFPMIYHGFYNEDVAWIGQAVKEGVRSLRGERPLFAGLYLPDFKDMAELKAGVEQALRAGAAGIALYGPVDQEVLDLLKGLALQPSLAIT